MIKLDIFYTKKMSLWMDLSIMLRTFPAVLEQVIESKIGTRARRQASAGDSASKPVAEQC
jgi:lipopolysaccharide/colanic/teichoic acid biosynthesis glycosyltransferase